ncbi:MAG TPA: DUF134 domain-containing protein [Candidatus Altiarchaeales archaeon]|nr:DUF134 domain-containing protein [Candidatus Altiarchaeales archaeon]
MDSKKTGRPKCVRAVGRMPDCDYFKPRGIPLVELEKVTLSLEEVEAIRLIDIEGLEQEDASQKMNISRRTFGRDLKGARKKISDAIINAKAIEIKGGCYTTK